MYRALMKKFFKYFLLPCFCVLSALLMLLQWSWFQKACLLGVLKCNFDEVNISNYYGSLNKITVEKIFCKNKIRSITISDFKFNWNPSDFLLLRGLRINDLQGKIVIDAPCQTIKSAESIIGSPSKGFLKIEKNVKKKSFLSYFQLPFRLNIENLNFWVQGDINNIKLETANISIQHLQPDHMGVCQYSSVVKFPSKQYSALQVNGSFNLKCDKKCKIESVKCKGRVRIFGDKRYPIIAYKGVVDNAASDIGETLKLEVHCGQSSDFTLIGEYFKTTDHIFSLKWQTVLDNSMLKLFNVDSLPTLSILAEGTGHLSRKTLTWDTHSYFSVWGKNFEALDPTLGSLPYLSLKAQVDGEFSKKFFRLKQYKAILKEKGVQKVFLDINSLQSITYDYKKGLKAENAEKLQVCEVNLYEVPFVIFNPYLQQYGYKILGNLKTGSLNVTWNSKTKQWELSLLQPILCYIQQFNKGKNNCITDSNCRLMGKCALNVQGTHGDYNFDTLFTDVKHIPFLKLSQQGSWSSKKNLNAHVGNLFFNNALAQNLLQLETVGLYLNPSLVAKLNYNIFLSKDKIKVNQFNFTVNSEQDKSMALQIDCDNPIVFEKGSIFIKDDGNVLHAYANKYPLDFITYKDVKLKGLLSYEGIISNDKQCIKLDTKTPFEVKNFNFVWRNDDWVNLKQIYLNLGGVWKNKQQWSFNSPEFRLISDEEKTPLFLGSTSISQEKNQTLTTDGKFVLDVTQLSVQPFALKYPGAVGNISGHWQTNDAEKMANVYVNITPLKCPVTVDLKSYYASNKNLVNSFLELRSSDHATDLQVDCSLKKDKEFALNVNSDHVYIDDLLEIMSWTNSLKKDSSVNCSSEVDVSKVTKNEKTKQSNYSVSLDFNLKSVLAKDVFARNLKGNVSFIQNKNITLKNFIGEIFNGTINMDGAYDFPKQKYMLDAKLEHVDLSNLFAFMKYYHVPFLDRAKVTGFFDGNVKGSFGEENFGNSCFNINCKAYDGTIRVFDSAVTFGTIVGGFASSLGLLAGSDANGRGAVNFLNTYLRAVPFKRFDCAVERSHSDKVGAKISIKNEDLALYTRTTIDTINALDWQQYPFVSELQLYASDSSPILNYFNFEKSLGSNQEYLKGPTCIIDGTLGKPNYSNLLKLILSSRDKKQEKPLQPVKNLLNSLFN